MLRQRLDEIPALPAYLGDHRLIKALIADRIGQAVRRRDVGGIEPPIDIDDEPLTFAPFHFENAVMPVGFNAVQEHPVQRVSQLR